MSKFRVFLTGDYLNVQGELAYPDIALDLLQGIPFLEVGFLQDQKPVAGDDGYWDKLYELEIQPQHVAQANGLIIFRPWVKSHAFSRGADSLVVIGRAGAGYDKVDLPACTANDVAVYNSPNTLHHATASAALLLLLALAKRLPQQERLVRTARWDRQPDVMGDDLPGKTLGIIGLGASGSELARLVSPFGMRLVAYSPRASTQQAARLGVTLVPNLDELLRQADFVSLHCRLEAQTRGLLGEPEFALLKPTVYLINVARGELIDQSVLVRSLRERRIAGAGLDVFEVEPLPADDPLLALDNVILTPHWLPSTRQAVRATMELVMQGMIRAASGQAPANVVNPEVLDRPAFRAKLARFAREEGRES